MGEAAPEERIAAAAAAARCRCPNTKVSERQECDTESIQ